MSVIDTSVTGAYVGASGFSYPEWKGRFYPEGARANEFLRHYAGRLPTVELNSTFYQLPSEERLAGWAEQTPPGFRFAVKLSRRIAHFGGLDLAPTFSERVHALGERLGPILVQLPPTRPRDDGFVQLLQDSLDPGLEVAWELRHPSWDGIEGLVRVNDLDADAPFRYLRLREHPYDDDALAAWAERLRPLLAAGVRVHCYFTTGTSADHSPGGEPTARTAERLLDFLD